MMKTLTLSKDVVSLIGKFSLEKTDEGILIPYQGLFGGGHVLEDMAMYLGCIDKAIKNTECDAEGRAFDDETEERLLKLYYFIVSNIDDIESLIHSSIGRFKITKGIYVFDEDIQEWVKTDWLWKLRLLFKR